MSRSERGVLCRRPGALAEALQPSRRVASVVEQGIPGQARECESSHARGVRLLSRRSFPAFSMLSPPACNPCCNRGGDASSPTPAARRSLKALARIMISLLCAGAITHGPSHGWPCDSPPCAKPAPPTGVTATRFDYSFEGNHEENDRVLEAASASGIPLVSKRVLWMSLRNSSISQRFN